MPLHLSHESLPALKDSIPTMGVGVDLNWPVKGKPVSCSWKQYLRFKLKLLVRSGFPPSKSFRLPASFPGGTWGCEEGRVVPLLILEFAILCGVPPGHWVPCTGVHGGVLALPGVGVQAGPRCWSLCLLPRPLALGVPPSCCSEPSPPAGHRFAQLLCPLHEGVWGLVCPLQGVSRPQTLGYLNVSFLRLYSLQATGEPRRDCRAPQATLGKQGLGRYLSESCWAIGFCFFSLPIELLVLRGQSGLPSPCFISGWGCPPPPPLSLVAPPPLGQ